jgi:hypothetical protein
MRRIIPLLIAGVLPLWVCPITRADYIYTFTETNTVGDQGSTKVTLDFSDAAVMSGKLRTSNLTSYQAKYTDTTAPGFSFTSTDTSDISSFGIFDVDSSGAITANNFTVARSNPAIFHIDVVGLTTSLVNAQGSLVDRCSSFVGWAPPTRIANRWAVPTL